MKNKFLYIFALLLIISCSKDTGDKNLGIKVGTGTVWLSGGLYFCATQIRMDGGDTLIPITEQQMIFYKGGQRVNILYKELETRETGCSIGKNC